MSRSKELHPRSWVALYPKDVHDVKLRQLDRTARHVDSACNTHTPIPPRAPSETPAMAPRDSHPPRPAQTSPPECTHTAGRRSLAPRYGVVGCRVCQVVWLCLLGAYVYKGVQVEVGEFVDGGDEEERGQQTPDVEEEEGVDWREGGRPGGMRHVDVQSRVLRLRRPRHSDCGGEKKEVPFML